MYYGQKITVLYLKQSEKGDTMKIDEAISVAKQGDRLYAQVMRELRKRNPDQQRISRLSRDARKVSARLKKLMGWE